MTISTRVLRKIITIDEEKCNGCGDCVPSCSEGAIQVIDGKARLVSEKYCDGLGACLNHCPMDALAVEEHWGEEFSEEAVKQHLKQTEEAAHPNAEAEAEAPLPCGCPSSSVRQFETDHGLEAPEAASPLARSMLTHWPIQLFLVPPFAPFLRNADLVLAADCAPFAYAGFHQDFLKSKVVVIACPKQDGYDYAQKLTQILKLSDIKSLTVLHMEVPCCFGLVHWAEQAVKASGKNIPLKRLTIGVRGELLVK
ncbi:MAG: 4Fe-4S binding protein [Dehalococcoidia bacterium]|nr:4Fe-4S binding protein [Dehalococcoidia bacterium]